MGEVPPRHQRLIQDARDAQLRLGNAERQLQAALNEASSAAFEWANSQRRLVNSQALLNKVPPALARAGARNHLLTPLKLQDAGWPGGPARYENVMSAIKRQAILYAID